MRRGRRATAPRLVPPRILPDRDLHPSPMRRLIPILSLVAAAALGATACNDPAPFAPDIATANFAPSLGVDIPNSVRTSSGLYYRDIVVGAGTQVPDTGSRTVTTGYQGFLRNGVQFDSGSFSFTTNTGSVIFGYNEGVRGMRVGGTRQLIIPPALGYGSRGSGSIPGNSILVFTVRLLNVS